ncbi:hypothetical protein [Gluconacetobacter tumulicola]|uniref:Uncharacterized protein n=1 Tax=Gluconacetobacter tumulicola TaxID=1017177 RepID=A0A7W4JDK8_9PROT|nr:hypothetical protein [Gluconacetobacter tumulicola]MBB2179320.1 hypothetical protein [Gluconacetobacter tumulicola]
MGYLQAYSREAFPERNREQHKEIFFHFLRHALEKKLFLLKEDPDFVRHLNSVAPPHKQYPLTEPRTPAEFEGFFRLFWPEPENPEYDMEILVVLEAGGRIWWMRGGEPTEWFLGYPGNKKKPAR